MRKCEQVGCRKKGTFGIYKFSSDGLTSVIYMKNRLPVRGNI